MNTNLNGNPWRNFLPVMGLFLLGLLMPSCAQAFHDGVCQSDVNRYCPDVTPGEGRLTTCMFQNATRLALDCRVEMLGAWEHLSAFQSTCGKDAARLCRKVEAGHGRIFTCLKMNQQAVSKTCKTKL